MRWNRTAAALAAAAIMTMGAPGPAWAHGADAVDAGDTAWVLVSSALVLLMTPGLAFFYGGLVRRRNVLSVLAQCWMLACAVTVQWVLVGYTLSFGPDLGGIIGGLDWAGLAGVGAAPNPDYAATIPHAAFMIFQAMFAVITPALIIGAFAERMRFSAFLLFSMLWSTLVYDPVCHWVWGVGGFLRGDGALDFAGGTVVHINAGAAALAAALVVGRRRGHPHHLAPPHQLPFAVLGAGILWFGWFGFNGGSALAANGIAVNAFVTTHVAAAAAGLAWSAIEWRTSGHPTVLGLITGAVAGLVAVTPAAGFVGPLAAAAIGGIASALCYVAVAVVKPRLGYDDSLDAFGVHGIGGLWGALATGLWATTAVNPAGADGLFYGHPAQLLIQAKAAVVTAVYSFAVSWALLKAVDRAVGLRVEEPDEVTGLDQTDHNESAYASE